MPGVIHLLPESTANQIAAGEVVQRPASVVKELMENAVDAGATLIKLLIKNGGCTHIQVDDNGCGMNAFDARMCWERHATSKITKAEDLYNLHTLGFRGEALASIASVSDVEMKTKPAEESVGTLIQISAGKVLTQENTACNQGTSISVKNLFYNIPARKNFLKSISVETKHILEEFQRIALAYPGIGFEFYNQENQVLQLKKGDLSTRIAQLFSVKEEELINTSEQTEIVGITGYLGSPKLAKRTRGSQYLFANGRFIKDAYLNHAITSAYTHLLEDGQYPFYVLFLDVDPSKIDVNIHPTKHEVKFEDGRHVYTLLQSVVKKSLGVHFNIPTQTQLINAVSSGNGNTSGSFQTSAPNARFNPFGAQRERVQTDWEKLDSLLKTPTQQDFAQSVAPKVEALPWLELPTNSSIEQLFQVENSFIIAKMDGELWIINQHRAHSHILFERYKNASTIASQQLLFPRTVSLSTGQYLLYQEMQEEINALGFDTSEFGKDTIIINGLPTELAKNDGADVILQILDEFAETYQKAKLSKVEALKLTAARNAAIKAGKALTYSEMQALVTDLVHCKEYATNASGKQIVVKLTKNSLERFFQ